MATSPEKWETVKALFDAALELDPSERSVFLRENCPDAEVRAEVERLLNEHEQAGTFLSTPVLGNLSLEAEAPTHELSESQLLAGRFRVVRFIAGGGMGEVYEAEDQELRERVAIKTIRPEILAQPNAMARFRREVHLARKVTHPNVCRIFDLFRHRPNGGSVQKEIVFTSMELLRGKTLAARLKEGGRMSVDEALPLVRQMASALAAAHAVGIVHRDFKPGNVVLVDVPGQQTQRTVVTDFGLALQSLVSDETASVSTGLGILGTPAYMSPEQLQGRAATTASDIYALGLVIYEMVTGTRPFQGDTPQSAALKRLSEAPPTPRRFEPGLSLVWESVILRCLERDPSQRFPTAEGVAGALVGYGPTLFRIRGQKIGERRQTAALAAVLVFALLVSGGLFYRSRQNKRLTDKDTIVLADFSNSTGDPIFDDTLKTALNISLRQSPFLNVLSDTQVAKTLQQMTRPVGTKLTPDMARELCQRTDNKAYIAGAIGSLGSEYVLGLKAVNCQNGDTLAEEQVTAASKEKVLDALGKAASEVRGELGESLATVQKFDVPLEQVTTSSLEALKAYSLGEATYRKNELPASIPFFQRAIELDPTFATAYAKLGAVYGNLGETTKAATNITKAFELRDRLSERERFYLSGHYYDQITGDLEKAVQIYQLWAKTYPREPAAFGNLAHFDFQIGRYDEALSAAQKCVRLEPSGLAYPILLASYLFLNRFDDAKATAAEAKSQHFDSYSIHLNLYLIAFVERDPVGMAREAAAATSTPGHDDTMLSYEALTAAYTGELARARDFSRRASDSAQRAGDREAAAAYLADAALQEVLVGNAARGKQGAATALAMSQGKSVKETASLAYAFAGEAVQADAIANDLARGSPEDTVVQSIILPIVRALDTQTRGNAAKAIAILNITVPYELGNAGQTYPLYTRGCAYLRAQNGLAAAAEFQKILDHRGVVPNTPLGALARLQIGRAYVMQGDTAKAKAAYEDFLTLWKDADADIPILKQAKAEYAKLQ